MAEVEESNQNYNSDNICSAKEESPMRNLPRDLLRRFMGVKKNEKLGVGVGVGVGVEEEMELSLGLSMNGRFGVDPTAKKIKRTTSIPELGREEGTGNLVRTCSLPTETEEEWRKRKELQTLRRMEARRKRSEKQRNLKKALREQQQRLASASQLVDQAYAEPVPLGRTLSLTSRVSRLALHGDTEKVALFPPPSPSIASSGISLPHSQLGTTPMDGRSPTNANFLQDIELKSTAAAGIAENTGKNAAAVTMRSQSNKHSPSPPQNRTKDIVRNLLEDMPCVSTKGEGPNGKRIEGFLYRYGKGEEVRIVCVCHGSFLTPSEFVKHAGGGEVANPLKHIVVSPSFL